MDPHQDPQQCRCHGQRQGHGGQSGPPYRQPDRECGGQGGVVARERPVARLGARGDRPGAVQRPARTFLVDDQLQRLADGVRHDGPGADEHGPRHRPRVPPAHSRPADPEQQQTEDDQRGLGEQLQQVPQPLRGVPDRPRQRPVGGYGGPPGDLGGAGPPQAAGGQHPDHGRRRRQQRGRPEQPHGPVVLMCVLCHAANVRRRQGPARGPNGRSGPRRRSGLTPGGAPPTERHRPRTPTSAS